jgi:hypothetical protein
LAALAAIRQDELNKRVSFEKSFTYLVSVCPVAAKATKKTKVSFNTNVSAAGGKKHPGGGLRGGNPSPEKGESGISLCYHTHKEFLDFNKDPRNELSEWTKANGGKKKGGGKWGGDSPRGSPKAAKLNKQFKSMIFEMEARQNKMFEAMAEVQQSSIAAIQASTSPESATKMKPVVSTLLGHAGDATKEVMFEHANVAMLKLTGILKSKDGKKA